MRLYRTISDRAWFGDKGCVITIGAYDGIHLGHQSVFEQLKEESKRLKCPAVAMSFEPTPGEFLARNDPPARLSRFREKYRAMAALGIDALFCPRFDDAMRRMSPESFVNELLVSTLSVRHVIVGDDFKFATQGSGNVDYLREAGSRLGFDVTEVGAIQQNSERVSSTAIRSALAAGNMRKARNMLGRDYSMSGHIVYGNQLGRTLGYPTANIPVMRLKSPVQGIFAVRVRGLGDELLDGVASVGTRPTVTGAGKTILEVFIFDFDRDIYGKSIEVQFISRLRDELKFPDLESMTAQIRRDVEDARHALARDG